MSRTFEIHTDNLVDADPAAVWDAVTVNTGGWLWPAEPFEQREGGAGPMGSVVTAWDPPRHFANHMEAEGGFYNTLDFQMSAEGNKTRVKYLHAGIFLQDFSDADWEVQHRGVVEHTDFYQHTLGQYVQYFPVRAAAFADLQGPETANTADAFQRLTAALGAKTVDQDIHVDVPGVGTVTGVVDYLTENFAGIRTAGALYRFFGRNAFGGVVGMTIHSFERDTHEKFWQEWLTNIYL